MSIFFYHSLIILLSDQFTLFQPGWADYAHNITTALEMYTKTRIMLRFFIYLSSFKMQTFEEKIIWLTYFRHLLNVATS